MSIPILQIHLDTVQVRDQKSTSFRQVIGGIQFILPKAFSAALLHPFPEYQKIGEPQIIISVFIAEKQQKEEL